MGARRIGQTHTITNSRTHSQYPRAPTAHYSAGTPALYSPNRPEPWSAGREWGEHPAAAPAPPVYRTTARYYRDPVTGSVGPQQTTTPKRNPYNGHTLQVAGMVLIRNSQNEIMVASILSNGSAIQDGNILVMSLSSRAALLCVHTHGVCARALSHYHYTVFGEGVQVGDILDSVNGRVVGNVPLEEVMRLSASLPPYLLSSLHPSCPLLSPPLPSSLTHTLSLIHAHAHTHTRSHSHSLFARSYREWKSFHFPATSPAIRQYIKVYLSIFWSPLFFRTNPSMLAHAHQPSTHTQHTR